MKHILNHHLLSFVVMSSLMLAQTTQAANVKATTSKAKASSSTSCKVCHENELMQRMFEKLNVTNEADRQKGYALVASFIEGLVAFSEAPRANSAERETTFRSYIQLAGAAVPFDMESQAAQVFSDIVEKDKALASVFDKEIKNMSDVCAAGLLQAMMKEHSCINKLNEAGRYETPGVRSKDDDSRAESCIQKFDYEQCKRTPASSVKPKPKSSTK